jgi:hypothetical protein
MAGLSSVPAAALRAELNRRQHGVRRLEKQRDKLMRTILKLEQQMTGMGGGPGSGRARNKQSLVEVLASVLKGKTLGVPEAADAVLATGYRSNAANFRLIVNQTLLKNKRFRKVSRGQYTVK